MLMRVQVQAEGELVRSQSIRSLCSQSTQDENRGEAIRAGRGGRVRLVWNLFRLLHLRGF